MRVTFGFLPGLDSIPTIVCGEMKRDFSLGNRMNPFQGMSNLRHWSVVTLFRNFGKLGRQTEDVIMIVYDPQILDFTFF